MGDLGSPGSATPPCCLTFQAVLIFYFSPLCCDPDANSGRIWDQPRHLVASWHSQYGFQPVLILFVLRKIPHALSCHPDPEIWNAPVCCYSIWFFFFLFHPLHILSKWICLFFSENPSVAPYCWLLDLAASNLLSQLSFYCHMSFFEWFFGEQIKVSSKRFLFLWSFSQPSRYCQMSSPSPFRPIIWIVTVRCHHPRHHRIPEEKSKNNFFYQFMVNFTF